MTTLGRQGFCRDRYDMVSSVRKPNETGAIPTGGGCYSICGCCWVQILLGCTTTIICITNLHEIKCIYYSSLVKRMNNEWFNLTLLMKALLIIKFKNCGKWRSLYGVLLTRTIVVDFQCSASLDGCFNIWIAYKVDYGKSVVIWKIYG